MVALQSLFYNTAFLYALLLIFILAVIIIIASLEVNYYRRKSRYASYKELLASPFAPGVSVIVPVRDDEADIVDRIRALLSLQYNDFEVIVVNDGSTDATFLNLYEFYQLEKVEYAAYEQITTGRVLAYYKSANPVFAKLTLIDKVRGGNSDALNAGINISEKDYVLCLEGKCFVDQHVLLKLVRPVLEEKRRVIHSAAAAYIANSSRRKEGHIVTTKFPGKLLPAFQVIEYLRAFLIERIAWNRLNVVHHFSSAANLFDREILISSGGYNREVKHGALELTLRMCRYMRENELDYKLNYIPEALCWIDAPASFVSLAEQRKNCAAGSLQAMWLHKDLFFNSRYPVLGWLKMPYMWLTELATPLLKILFLIVAALLYAMKLINGEYLLIFGVLAYSVTVLVSALSLLFEEKLYRPYASGKDILKICLLLLVEPFIYQPLTVYWKVAAAFTAKRKMSYLKNDLS